MLKQYSRQLIHARWFELFIIAVIITNSVLIGVETYRHSEIVANIQRVILGIFTFEIIARFIARESVKSFFKSGWNIFDLSLVLINYIPESLFENSSMLMVLRVARVFRVLRLLRTSEEIKVTIAVLVRSCSALFYNGIFFFIFLYMFSIMAVTLFKLPDPSSLDVQGKAAYESYLSLDPHTPAFAPDPYGDLSESMFSLFRILTGDDWADIRYSLIKASDLGLIHVGSTIITTFHVVWFVLSAFLLLNLIVGAIVNNYQVIMEETRRKREETLRQETAMLESSPS